MLSSFLILYLKEKLLNIRGVSSRREAVQEKRKGSVILELEGVYGQGSDTVHHVTQNPIIPSQLASMKDANTLKMNTNGGDSIELRSVQGIPENLQTEVMQVRSSNDYLVSENQALRQRIIKLEEQLLQIKHHEQVDI